VEAGKQLKKKFQVQLFVALFANQALGPSILQLAETYTAQALAE
jgi:hypothetical protein